MKESTMLSIMAFLAALFVLASSAFADCSLCGKEADWSRSANEFIEWDPLGDEPAAFGLKEAAGPSMPSENGPQDAQSMAEGASDNDSKIVALQSINATPATIKSGGTTRIAAVFAINDSERETQGEVQLSAYALIKDSAGAEVAKLMLIRSSANQYFSNWVAAVPPGRYSLDIGITSPGAARFKDALQIDVVS